MRTDKLTTRFQQAIAEAQSLAAGASNPYIEPLHVLSALLVEEGGVAKSLLERAGANLARLREAVRSGLQRLPQVQGGSGELQVSRELTALFNLTDREAQKRGDQYISSELFLLALVDDKSEAGRALKEAGVNRKALEQAVDAVRGGAACRRLSAG